MGPPPIQLVQQIDGPDQWQFNVQTQAANGAVFTHDFTLSGSPWEPGAYLTWAQPLAAAWKVTPTPAPEGVMTDDQLTAMLAEPTMKNFLQANGELSAALTQSPANAGLHDEAALLLVALAWSEAAGNFSDPRELLNGACAQLAMAEVLRGGAPAGTAGQLAETTLLVLTGREAEADKKLDALAATANLPQATQEWVTALRLANFNDWRKFMPGADASLLWRRTYYWAVTENVSPDAGLQYYAGLAEHPEPDWARIALGRPFSVGVGNTFTSQGLKDETAELKQLILAVEPEAARDKSGKAAEKFLNEEHTGPWQDGRLEVVTHGMWGARAQRHLLAMTAETYYHLEDMLGVPEEAAQLRQQFADPLARDLRLGPFLSYHLAANQQEYDAAMNAAAALLRAHPEWASARNWLEIRTKPNHWTYRDIAPDYAAWFHPWLPSGTTYDTVNRLTFPEMDHESVETFQKWQQLAPLKPSIALGLLCLQFGENPTPEQATAALTPMREYNLALALKVADASVNDPVQYKQAMQMACALDPQQYMELGRVLEDAGHFDEAAIAYQQAVDSAPDRVGVANEMEFLVNYYYDHGQPDLAMKTAQMAADVYSCGGLEVLARLYTRMGKYAMALDISNEMKERYGRRDFDVVVYETWAKSTGEAEPAREAEERMKEIFPNGVEPVKLTDLAQAPAPTDGVQLLEESYFTDHNGLKKGDVVVGINGQRVHNFEQYCTALDLPLKVEYDVIYWHEGQYGEGKMYLPDRRFDVDAKTYPVNGQPNS
jgi:tetratricopeptide (TPR) repeat protein